MWTTRAHHAGATGLSQHSQDTGSRAIDHWAGMLQHGSRRRNVFVGLQESVAACSAASGAAHTHHYEGAKGQKVISHCYPFLEMLSVRSNNIPQMTVH